MRKKHCNKTARLPLSGGRRKCGRTRRFIAAVLSDALVCQGSWLTPPAHFYIEKEESPIYRRFLFAAVVYFLVHLALWAERGFPV